MEKRKIFFCTRKKGSKGTRERCGVFLQGWMGSSNSSVRSCICSWNSSNLCCLKVTHGTGAGKCGSYGGTMPHYRYCWYNTDGFTTQFCTNLNLLVLVRPVCVICWVEMSTWVSAVIAQHPILICKEIFSLQSFLSCFSWGWTGAEV